MLMTSVHSDGDLLVVRYLFLWPLHMFFVCFTTHAGVWPVCQSFVCLVKSYTFHLGCVVACAVPVLSLCLHIDDVCICTVSSNKAEKTSEKSSKFIFPKYIV